MKKLLHAELVQQRLTNEQALTVERHPVSLLLYNIRSLYNVGSIFRTADSGLAQKLILCGYTPYPPRKEITKTALGAVDTVPWEYYSTAEEAIERLRDQGTTICALELVSSGKSLYSLEPGDFPLCFVLGNEITGVDDQILGLCDMAVEIPMYGVKHSLNVSVAAGISLFEAVRVWKQVLREEQ